MTSFTSRARSCCVQCPQPGSMTIRPKLRHERREIRDELLHSREPDNEITVAGDVEGRDGDNGAGERRQQLPVAIDVAVPAEPAAKAGAAELTGIEFDVGGAQPRRQSIRIGCVIEKATAPRNHGDAIAPGRVARAGVREPAYRRAHVALELGLSHSRSLEVELVEDRLIGPWHGGGGPHWTARSERHAEADHGAEEIGAQ